MVIIPSILEHNCQLCQGTQAVNALQSITFCNYKYLPNWLRASLLIKPTSQCKCAAVLKSSLISIICASHDRILPSSESCIHHTDRKYIVNQFTSKNSHGNIAIVASQFKPTAKILLVSFPTLNMYLQVQVWGLRTRLRLYWLTVLQSSVH